MEKKLTFNLKNEKEVVIYGASHMGKQLYHRLKEKNYIVRAFIDKNAQQLDNYAETPIYDMEDPNFHKIVIDNPVIFIALTNREEQSIVADYLAESGFDKIVFCSANTIYDNITKAYESILNREDTIDFEMPCYDLKQNNLHNESKYFERDKESHSVTAFLPMELLFVQRGDEVISIYEDIPLLTFFRFLSNGCESNILERYFEKHNKENNWSSWMDEKRNYYKSCSSRMDMEMSGNEQMLPYVKSDQKSRFIIYASYEHVIFLLSQNRKRVKCVLSEEDFLDFENNECRGKIDTFLKQKKCSYVYTPILNNAYYDFPCKREECGKTRIAMICEAFRNLNISVQNKSVLDAGCCLAYIAQHMYRMGAKVTAVEYNSDNYQLACLINSLLRCDEINMINDGIQNLDKMNKYDIVLMIAVLNWHLDTKLGEDMIRVIDSITSKYLIWESGDKIDYEKQWILQRTTFSKYHIIGKTFGNGKYREMGIFEK